MTTILKTYLLHYCRDWMKSEELKALRRWSIYPNALEKIKQLALKDAELDKHYGFQDKATNELVQLGQEKGELAIAKRIMRDHEEEVINNCPKCHQLARTPKAKQCRFCGYDWH